MNRRRYHLISAILACLLAACNIGDPTVYPDIEVPDVPEKSKRGSDYIVCMVNNNMNFELYREVPQMMFDNEDVHLNHFLHNTPGGSVSEYSIFATRFPEGKPRTSIELSVEVDKPEINRDYRLSSARYNLEGFYSSGQYRLDTNVSMIRFSRIDTIIAAGEFVFRAIDQVHDTVDIRGYFDIPFADN